MWNFEAWLMPVIVNDHLLRWPNLWLGGRPGSHLGLKLDYNLCNIHNQCQILESPASKPQRFKLPLFIYQFIIITVYIFKFIRTRSIILGFCFIFSKSNQVPQVQVQSKSGLGKYKLIYIFVMNIKLFYSVYLKYPSVAVFVHAIWGNTIIQGWVNDLHR